MVNAKVTSGRIDSVGVKQVSYSVYVAGAECYTDASAFSSKLEMNELMEFGKKKLEVIYRRAINSGDFKLDRFQNFSEGTAWLYLKINHEGSFPDSDISLSLGNLCVELENVYGVVPVDRAIKKLKEFRTYP